MPVGHIFLQETSTVGHILTNKLYNLNGNLKFGNDFILKSNNPQGILSFDNGSQPVSLNLTNLTISNGNLSVNEDLSINGGTITSSTLTNSTFTGTVSGITKSMVGLSNVDNTSDVNKPISSVVQLALTSKQNTLTNGILNTNNVVIDGSVSSGDYAQFTANGLEGKNLSSLKTDLAITHSDITNLSNWSGSTNLISLGNITSGTWQASTINESYIDNS